MPVYGRIIMGCIAIGIAWTMVRAARSGVVHSEDRSYAENDQPGMFVLMMIGDFVCILFCLWVAAGYTPRAFLAQFGLGALSQLF
jgi:hypothetical protein